MIFTIQDGDTAFDVKDYLIEQERLDFVELDQDVYPGRYSEQKQELWLFSNYFIKPIITFFINSQFTVVLQNKIFYKRSWFELPKVVQHNIGSMNTQKKVFIQEHIMNLHFIAYF